MCTRERRQAGQVPRPCSGWDQHVGGTAGDPWEVRAGKGQGVGLQQHWAAWGVWESGMDPQASLANWPDFKKLI